VMISHDNATWTSSLVIKEILNVNETDSLVSYLPLSHIAAQMVDVHGPMSTGLEIWFAQPDALRGSLVDTLKEARPTIFLGVPRVWEKIAEKMQAIGSQNTGIKKYIADLAKSIGLQGSYAEQRGEAKPWGWWLADKIVFYNIKQALGLERVRFCATAAAPIGKETLDYFMSLYIPIYEIYGMSECTGPQTVNRLGAHKTGTAGPSIPFTEIRIDAPDQDGNGEVCFRGRHIFMGYLKNGQASSEAIDENGWLHSGDIGKMVDGYLSITGRIKELIITAGGENIPPILIEEEFRRQTSQVVANCMLVGDRKKFLVMVITLQTELKKECKPGDYPLTNLLTETCRSALGTTATTVEEAKKDPKVLEYIQQGINRTNQNTTSQAQKIQKFMIAPEDFTLEGLELTPTMKLKRRIVLQKYLHEIEALYKVDD